MHDIEQIYKEYFNTVYKYLLVLSHNSDISEELTQETFTKAVIKINTYKGNSAISVWLCQIAKNLYLDYLKKNKKTFDMGENLLDLQENNSLENNVIEEEEKILLYKQIQNLDEKTREVMYLRLTGELSFKEIGTILNQTENWARVTFYRGKQKLKEGF